MLNTKLIEKLCSPGLCVEDKAYGKVMFPMLVRWGQSLWKRYVLEASVLRTKR